MKLIFGNRRKHIRTVAKYAHGVLDGEADGNPNDAIRVLKERISERRMELDGLDAVSRDKQREMSGPLNDEIKLMEAAVAVLAKLYR